MFSIYAADPAVPTYDEEKTFTWTVKNPCIDDTLVSITKPDDLGTGLTYNLGSGPLELPAHGLFEIDFKNKNVPNDLCGDLTFEAKYENGAIGSSPVTAYDPTTRVFTIESSDATLDSTSKTISVTASLVNYNPDDDALFSSADQQTSSSQISFIGCNFPTLAEIQDSSEEIGPNKYDDLPVTFDASTLFTIAPSSCDITYSCSTVDALPCDDAGSVTSFDTTTGVFTFQAGTDQFSTYPPGTYSFTVTGTAGVGGGETSESVEFTLTLVDLCIEDVQLSLTAKPANFVFSQQVIGDPLFNLKFNERTMATYTPDIDCGFVETVFTQEDDSTPLDRDLMIKHNRLKFRIFEGTLAKVGYYPVFYSVRLS